MNARRTTPERVPIRWKHLIDQNARKDRKRRAKADSIRWTFAPALAVLAALAAPAVADDGPAGHWRPTEGCPRGQMAPRDYSRCLHELTRTSEVALEAEFANAMMVVEQRSDLAPVQRSRWRGLLDESQSRFLIYRNFDCQSVAPFEGPRGIGNFEQRSLCMIEANIRRARDLRERYGSPMTPAVPAAPDTGRGDTWILPTLPPLD